jgi:cell division protein FtsW (lipid II flippase)
MNLRFLPESHTDFVLAVTPGLAFFGLALCLMSAAAVAFIVVRRRSGRPRS